MKEMNPAELQIVSEHLLKQGITDYSARQGNNCIWVNYGVINSYYIFRDGKLVDIQID